MQFVPALDKDKPTLLKKRTGYEGHNASGDVIAFSDKYDAYSKLLRFVREST